MSDKERVYKAIAKFTNADPLTDMEVLLLLNYYRKVEQALSGSTPTPREYHLVLIDASRKASALQDILGARE